MEQESVIAGMEQYCDRWCERCPQWTRCAIGRAESQRTVLDDEQTRKQVSQMVAVMQRYPALAAPSRASAEVRGDRLYAAARGWMMMAGEWVGQQGSRPPSPARQEAEAVIAWQQHAVFFKISRALRSRRSGQADDANGSARVAWLSLAAAAHALGDLFDEGCSAEDTLMLLSATLEVLQLVEGEFPRQASFQRPGLD